MTVLTRGRRGPVLAATGIGAAGLLGASLTTRPGSGTFYVLTMGLAGTWAVGALSGGPVPLARPGDRRSGRRAALAVLTGGGAFGLFYGAARLARHVPPLSNAIGSVLGYADSGSTPLVLLTACTSAVAEELFFRGALWSAVHRSRPLATTTLAYAATTAATRNPALVLAGTATSVLFGLQRRASGGILVPAITHVTWSVLMLRYLPPLFRDSGGPWRPERAEPRAAGPRVNAASQSRLPLSAAAAGFAAARGLSAAHRAAG